MKRTYHNLPKPLSRKDYEECCRLVVEDASKNPTVSAVYLMGGEWSVGISDLDLVIVYKTGIAPQLVKSPWSLSPESKFIFTHRYLSVDEAHFRSFYYLYPEKTANLRLLWGADSLPESPSQVLDSGEQSWLFACILMDILINKLFLFPRYRNGALNVRAVIGELYSLIYSFDMLEALNGKRMGSAFEVSVRKLRDEWFDNSEDENMRKLEVLIEESLSVVADIALALEAWFHEHASFQDVIEEVWNERYTLRSIHPWDKEIWLDAFFRHTRRFSMGGHAFEHYVLMIPEAFGGLLSAYIAQEGMWSDRMRISSKGRSSSLSFSPGAGRHVKTLNMFYQMAVQSDGFFKIPYTYGFPTMQQTFFVRMKKRLIGLLFHP